MKSKSLILLVIVALAGFVPQSKAVPTVDLGSASSFAILAGTEITDAGGASTIVTGNVGVYPGTADGLLAAQVHGGTIYSRSGDDVLLLGAKNDLTAAYDDAAGRTPFTTLVGLVVATDNQLGGQTLFPGVYRFGHGATANLTGTLILDANGDLNPVWIFQATSDFITATGSKVVLIGADSCDVFWQIGSSATQLGKDSGFVGTIMALTSINLLDGAKVDGRLLARNGDVTLIHDTIDNTCVVPEPSSFWPVAFFTSVFSAWQWLAMWRRKAGHS